MKRWVGKHGFTLVEAIVVLVVLAILAAIVVPSYIGFLSRANEKTCEINRTKLLQYYDLYYRYYDKNVDFATYVKENYGDPTTMCPSGGVYEFGIAGDVMVVTCTEHTKSEKTKLIADLSPAGLMQNAKLIFATFESLLNQYKATYSNLRMREFVSLNGHDIVWDGKTELNISQDLVDRLDLNGVTFSDMKLYMKQDAAGKYIPEISHVYVKSGNSWVKYSSVGEQTGTGAVSAKTPPPAGS